MPPVCLYRDLHIKICFTIRIAEDIAVAPQICTAHLAGGTYLGFVFLILLSYIKPKEYETAQSTASYSLGFY